VGRWRGRAEHASWLFFTVGRYSYVIVACAVVWYLSVRHTPYISNSVIQASPNSQHRVIAYKNYCTSNDKDPSQNPAESSHKTHVYEECARSEKITCHFISETAQNRDRFNFIYLIDLAMLMTCTCAHWNVRYDKLHFREPESYPKPGQPAKSAAQNRKKNIKRIKKTKNWDARKKRSGHKVRRVSREAGKGLWW